MTGDPWWFKAPNPPVMRALARRMTHVGFLTVPNPPDRPGGDQGSGLSHTPQHAVNSYSQPDGSVLLCSFFPTEALVFNSTRSRRQEQLSEHVIFPFGR